MELPELELPPLLDIKDLGETEKKTVTLYCTVDIVGMLSNYLDLPDCAENGPNRTLLCKYTPESEWWYYSGFQAGSCFSNFFGVDGYKVDDIDIHDPPARRRGREVREHKCDLTPSHTAKVQAFLSDIDNFGFDGVKKMHDLEISCFEMGDFTDEVSLGEAIEGHFKECGNWHRGWVFFEKKGEGS